MSAPNRSRSTLMISTGSGAAPEETARTDDRSRVAKSGWRTSAAYSGGGAPDPGHGDPVGVGRGGAGVEPSGRAGGGAGRVGGFEPAMGAQGVEQGRRVDREAGAEGARDPVGVADLLDPQAAEPV